MVCRARTDYWTPRVRRVAALFASVRRQNGNASTGAPHQPPAGLQFSSAGHGTPYIRSYRNTTAVGNVRKLFPVALGTYVKKHRVSVATAESYQKNTAVHGNLRNRPFSRAFIRPYSLSSRGSKARPASAG